MEQMATVVKDKLIKEMPNQKETFEKNYQAVEEKLKNLDQDFRTVTSEAKQKILLQHT